MNRFSWPPRFSKRTVFIIKYSIILLLALVLVSILFIRCSADKDDKGDKESDEPEEIEGDIIIDDVFEDFELADSTGDMTEELPEELPVQEVTFQDTSPEAEVEQLSVKERLAAIEGMSLAHDTGYIFVGDSRFVHMNDVCKISGIENQFMVAKVGEGYSWFSTTALQQIKRIISTGLFKKWKLVICLGVNDLGSLDKYVKKYNELKDTYDISLVSVNPITQYGSLDNKQIEKFNAGIKQVDVPYIDTYRLLMVTGFTTTDGLHYNADTSKKIYNGILLGLQDEDPNCLVKDPANVLDKASLSKKNSLQKEILAANKYVPKPAANKTTSSNTSTKNTTVNTDTQTQTESTTTTEPTEADMLRDQGVPVGEDGQIDQDYLDALYGIDRKKEEEQGEEERREEERHEEEDRDEDEDDDDDD